MVVVSEVLHVVVVDVRTHFVSRYADAALRVFHVDDMMDMCAHVVDAIDLTFERLPAEHVYAHVMCTGGRARFTHIMARSERFRT